MPVIPSGAQDFNVEGLGYLHALVSQQGKQTVAYLKLSQNDVWLTLTFDAPISKDNLRLFLQNKEVKQKVESLVSKYFKDNQKGALEEGQMKVGRDPKLTSDLISKIGSSIKKVFLSREETSSLTGQFLKLAPESSFYGKLNKLKIDQKEKFANLYMNLVLARTLEEKLTVQASLDAFIKQLDPGKVKNVQGILQECYAKDRRAAQINRFEQLGLLNTFVRLQKGSKSHERYIADLVSQLPLPEGRKKAMRLFLLENYEKAFSSSELRRFWESKLPLMAQGLTPSEVDKIKATLIDAFVDEAAQLGE